MNRSLTLTAICAAGLALPAAAQTELSMWYHGAGSTNAEEALVNQVVEEFNASQDEWRDDSGLACSGIDLERTEHG